jgi:gliding motility-associated-like protein
MKKFTSLLMLLLTFAAFTAKSQMFILNEDFSSAIDTIPPLEWNNVVIAGNISDKWHFDNPGGQVLGFPAIEPFAIFDAGNYSNNNQHEQVALESPAFDASISNFIILEFDHKFIQAYNSSCKIQAYNGTEWFEVISYNSSIPAVTHAVVDISTHVGGITNAQLRFEWSGNGNGFWAFDNVRIYGALPVDAGVVSIDSPVMPFIQGIHPVIISLKNFGYYDLNNATLKWTVNGAQQPDFAWSGSIAFGQTLSEIQIGTFDFQNEVLLKVWPQNPNGQDDPNPYNDTAIIVLNPMPDPDPPLCGTYTIGGTNPDFADFITAVNRLNTSGITCPVVFKVRDGDYYGQFTLEDIEGSSELNTITFESESGINTAVMIRFDPWTHAANLDSTSFVTFKAIGFQGGYVGCYQSATHKIVMDSCYFGGYYGMFVDNQSNEITIENCRFQGSEWGLGLRSGSHDILIHENVFNGARHGLVVNTGIEQNANIMISENQFNGQNYSSFHSSTARGVIFDNNSINTSSTGIYSDNTIHLTISNNRIQSSASVYWHNSGIHLENATDSLRIFNNFITLTGAYRGDGIFVQNSTHTEVCFNSINLANTDISNQSNGLYVKGGAQNDFRNNISMIKNSGYPVLIAVDSVDFTIDYNDYYHPAGLIGQFDSTNFYSLDEWRSSLEQDLNSFNENPFYTSDIDLSVNQMLLNNAGTPISWVQYDIDSTLRNPSNPDIGAKEFGPCPTDAGINWISSPKSPVNAGTYAIKVILQNHGYSVLNSAIINWTVNGTPQTALPWNGTLAGGENAEVTIGSYTFEGGLYKLKAWTAQPNGENDCNILNDTTSFDLACSLCGEYTIGGIEPDFATVIDAVSTLNMAGITCPVVFNIRNGNYYGQFLMEDIDGSSEQNTITFQSESGDSNAVIISYGGWPNNTVTFKNTKNIVFKEIGFHAENVAFHQIETKNITIENCYFSGRYGIVLTDTTYLIKIVNCAFYYGSWGYGMEIQSGSHDIEVKGSTFIGATHGIVISNGNTQNGNIIITGNEFTGQSNSSVQTSSTNGVIIEENHINTNRTGIYSDNSNNLIIRNNRIQVTSQTDWHNSGIHLENATDTVLIYNNYIYSTGIYRGEGIFIQNSYRTGVYFNSIKMANTEVTAESKGIMLNGGSQNDIKNNISMIATSGYPLFVTTNTQNFSFDYNDYYHPEGLICHYDTSNYFSMEAWNEALGQDLHSLTENPFYTSNAELAMNQILLNNAGTPVSGIQHDIDSTFRHQLHPDMGAKEYDLCAPDAGINLITSPTDPVISGNHEVKVVLQNQGTATLNSVIINWQVNDETQVPFTWSGSLPTTAKAEVSIGSYSFSGGLYTIKAWATQPNGVEDCNHFNDSTYRDMAASLCGIYSIGGTNPDFHSFIDAVTTLNRAGITCPVVFKVADGDYYGQFILEDVQGSSPQNTITFESVSGDSLAALIRYDVWPYNTATFRNSKNIIFKGIGFRGAQIALHNSNTQNIRFENCYFNGNYGLMLDDQSKEIDISNCNFQGGDWGLGFRSGSHDIDVNECIFIGASHGVVVNSGLEQPANVTITNNEFLNQNYSSVYVSIARDVFVEENNITTNRTGIYADNAYQLYFGKNRIKTTSQGDWHNSGIHLETNTDTVKIINNYIQSFGGSRCEGIFIQNSYRTKVLFNGINISTSDVAEESKGLYLNGGAQNEIRNNISSVNSAGFPVFVTQGTGSFILDYNNYFQTEGLIGQHAGANYTSLSAWGQAINGDANSNDANPYFASDENPLPYQRELNGSGIPVSDVLLDINGKIRNDQAPDIGCVEFTVDFGITDLFNPTLDCFHTSIDSVTVYLRQFGDIPFINLNLAYQVNDGPVQYDMLPGTIYNDLIFTFSTTVNISIEGEYRFKIWMINALDDNLNNDTLQVIRYSKPLPVLTTAFTNQCTWREVFFTGQAEIPDPYFISKYEWQFGDDTFSDEQNPVHVYETPGLYNVKFVAYSNAGCSSEKTIEVFIDPDYEVLSLDLEITNEVCSGDGQGSVEIQASGGSPPYTYFMNGEEISGSMVSSVIPGTYGFKVFDSQLCEISDTAILNPAIYMNPNIVNVPDSGSAPMNVTFGFQAENVSTCLWDFGNGLTSSEFNPSFTFDTYGEKTVILTVNSGEPNFCEETDTVTIFVDVNIVISANNVFTPNDDGLNDYFEVRTNGITLLNAKIYDRTGKLIHEIENVDGKWDGKTPELHDAPEGVYFYNIAAKAFNGSDHTSQGTVMLLRDDSGIRPNPVSQVLKLKPGGLLKENLTIEVLNIQGNVLLSFTAIIADEIELDMTSLHEGFYILKVCDSRNCIFKRFIKK